MSTSHPFVFRPPADLIERIRALASRDERPVGNMMVKLLREAIEARNAAIDTDEKPVTSLKDLSTSPLPHARHAGEDFRGCMTGGALINPRPRTRDGRI